MFHPQQRTAMINDRPPTTTSREREEAMASIPAPFAGFVLLLTLILFSPLQSFAQPQPENDPGDQVAPNRSAVILQRNIFAPRRPRPQLQPTPRNPDAPPQTRDQPSEATGPRFAEATCMLNGVILREAELVAFIEDPDTGETRLMHTGDPLMNGRIVKIDIDGIVYTIDGKERRIPVGQTVRGKRQITDSADYPAPDAGDSDTDDNTDNAPDRRPADDAADDASPNDSADTSPDNPPTAGARRGVNRPTERSNDSDASRNSSGRESLIERMRRRRQEEMQP